MTPLQISFTFPSENKKEPQILLIRREIFNGPQHSVFFNEAVPESEENTFWNEEYIIRVGSFR
jgi:hypothetical protein